MIPEKWRPFPAGIMLKLKRPDDADARDQRDDRAEDRGLAIVRRDRRRLARHGNVFTACRIRNRQTAQFETQRE